MLVTATDGNHGFGVAYLAKLFGCKAKVMMLSMMIGLMGLVISMVIIMKMTNRSLCLLAPWRRELRGSATWALSVPSWRLSLLSALSSLSS